MTIYCAHIDGTKITSIGKYEDLPDEPIVELPEIVFNNMQEKMLNKRASYQYINGEILEYPVEEKKGFNLNGMWVNPPTDIGYILYLERYLHIAIDVLYIDHYDESSKKLVKLSKEQVMWLLSLLWEKHIHNLEIQYAKQVEVRNG